MGVTTRRWLPDYFRKTQNDGAIRGKATDGVLQHLVETGFATPVGSRASRMTPTYRRRCRSPHPIDRTTLLSPFDSLVWDRRRASELFGFELMLEAYTPAPKRQYGYFSLPILYRDQLVGRLDPKRSARPSGSSSRHSTWSRGSPERTTTASTQSLRRRSAISRHSTVPTSSRSSGRSGTVCRTAARRAGTKRRQRRSGGLSPAASSLTTFSPSASRSRSADCSGSARSIANSSQPLNAAKSLRVAASSA